MLTLSRAYISIYRLTSGITKSGLPLARNERSKESTNGLGPDWETESSVKIGNRLPIMEDFTKLVPSSFHLLRDLGVSHQRDRQGEEQPGVPARHISFG